MTLSEEDLEEARELIEFRRWREERELALDQERRSSIERVSRQAERIRLLCGIVGGVLASVVAASWQVFAINQRIGDLEKEISSIRQIVADNRKSSIEAETKIQKLDKDLTILIYSGKPPKEPNP